MTKAYPIVDLLAGKVAADTEVRVQGWVRTRRDSKAGISFIHLHDGSGFDPIQCVVPSSLGNYNDQVLKLTAGCSVEITGNLVESQGQGQAFEVQVAQVTVLGWVENPEQYPIAAKRHTLEYLRDFAHLRPRTNTIGAITRVRHTAAMAIHEFFDQHGFVWVHTPIITSNDCEGAGELFQVKTHGEDFFGHEVYLTVSGQLNAEAYALALSKVYTFGPTFRAENSNTSRHLAEFWMIEPELAFADLNDICGLAEDLLKAICITVLTRRADDMAFFAEHIDKTCITRLQHIIDSPFEKIDYTAAIKILENSKKKFEFPIAWGSDLQSEHERFLAEEHVGRPVIIQNYPKGIKSFYMRLNDDGKTVAAMDVLAPGIGEIIGGSQREERLDLLDQRMQEANLSLTDYNWYRDLRRYGSVKHAGFGLGFERLISYLTGVSNVRDVIPYPRTPGRADY